MPARSSSLGLRLLWRPLGFLSNKCVYYMHINYSWNFHQNIFTLTISFIVLNAAIEFVLIFRPHGIYIKKFIGKTLINSTFEDEKCCWRLLWILCTNKPLVSCTVNQGCGSGSAWICINLSCWIRIRISIQISDPDPDPGGQKWPTKIEKSTEFSCF